MTSQWSPRTDAWKVLQTRHHVSLVFSLPRCHLEFLTSILPNLQDVRFTTGMRGHSAVVHYPVSIVRSLVCNCQLQPSGATPAEVVEALHTTNTSQTPLDCSYLITAHQEQSPLSNSQLDSKIGQPNNMPLFRAASKREAWESLATLHRDWPDGN